VLSTLNVTGGATAALESGTVTIRQTTADTSTAATTLNLNGSGFIGAIDGSQADVYTTVAITADSAFTIADVNFAAATAVTAAGAGATTISALTDVGAVTSFTSTGGGLKLGAAIGNAVTFTGSAGTDAVLVGATTKAITMGAGDDSVTISADVGTGGSIDGGTGTDTLVLNVASGTFSDASAQPRITGFETLGLGTAATGSYSANGFTGMSIGGTTTGNVTFTNVAAGAGLTLTASAVKTVDITLADATGTADVFGVTMSSAGALDYTSTSDINLAGIETVNFTMTDTDTTAHENVATLVATSAKTVTVTGNAGLDLTNTGNAAITSFDASGVTLGKVTDTGITFDSVNTTVGEAVSIKGSNGVDTLTGSATAADTIDGGAGVDTIVYDGGKDVITGGAGKDVFDIDALGTETVHVTITDLAVGDTIEIAGIDTGTATWNATKVAALGASATLANYLDAAAAGAGNVNSIARWFNYDGDTYIVNDNTAGATFAATDAVIEITGVIDLSDSTLATTVLTIA
jgi:S-layer protein